MRLIIAFLLALLPATARAEWLETSSAHFVVYADDSERDIRRVADQLERYHSAMVAVTGRTPAVPSPSNRVTVFVVDSTRQVRRLAGAPSSSALEGFYIPRAGGSLAIIPRVNASRGRGLVDESMMVLLHEYAHHFMISGSSEAMPRWLSEGGAEFFASASFDANGGVGLGRPAIHRAGELFHGRDVVVADLIDPTNYEKRKDRSYDAFYGKSWLLYHYLTFDEKRRGQFDRYRALLREGKSPRDAGLGAFGDFAQLERELDAYLKVKSMRMLGLPASMLTVAPVTVRRLSAGEAAMMPLRVRSRLGVDEAEAAALVVEVRAVAARFPGDAAVLAALAEAEHDAGHHKEAIAAANAAIAIDPSQVNAYVQKGFAYFGMAAKADKPAPLYAEGRKAFVALNRREHDHPLPLVYFYRSYVEQGDEPPPLAIDGLVRAVQVAPFDLGLRMTLGQELIQRGRLAEARISLQPIANNPHGGEMADAARVMLLNLDVPNAKRGSADSESARNAAGSD